LVRVTAPVQFGRRHVAPLVTRFLDAYPETQVELVLNDRNLDLIDDELDVAVRIGRLSDSSLLARRVGEVKRVVVASPDYLARRGIPLKLPRPTWHSSEASRSIRSRYDLRYFARRRI
jgi:DNA-binding transcriptional LysR family regulator